VVENRFENGHKIAEPGVDDLKDLSSRRLTFAGCLQFCLMSPAARQLRY